MAEAARKFHFLREIAAGGFGSVYLAKVMHSDGFSRLAAVKLLHQQWSENAEIARRMRDEARLLGWLRHRNIVDVIGLTTIGGRVAVVMEYLEAVDLKAVVQSHVDRGQPAPPRGALEAISFVASALDAAYNRPPYQGERPLRVIHRDIKPSNIMLDESGTVKVLDFGVARAEFDQRESHTQEMQFGSIEYMPPERLFMEPDTPASDVYSLGATLYELLALERFGKARSRPERHGEFLDERLQFLRSVAPGMSGTAGEQLIEFLRSLLAHSVADRPTAADVVGRCRLLSRSFDGDGLTEWAETVVPPLVKAMREAPREPNPLVDSVLTEDSATLAGDDDPGRPPLHGEALEEGSAVMTGVRHPVIPSAKQVAAAAATPAAARTVPAGKTPASPEEPRVAAPTIAPAYVADPQPARTSPPPPSTSKRSMSRTIVPEEAPARGPDVGGDEVVSAVFLRQQKPAGAPPPWQAPAEAAGTPAPVPATAPPSPTPPPFDIAATSPSAAVGRPPYDLTAARPEAPVADVSVARAEPAVAPASPVGEVVAAPVPAEIPADDPPSGTSPALHGAVRDLPPPAIPADMEESPTNISLAPDVSRTETSPKLFGIETTRPSLAEVVGYRRTTNAGQDAVAAPAPAPGAKASKVPGQVTASRPMPSPRISQASQPAPLLAPPSEADEPPKSSKAPLIIAALVLIGGLALFFLIAVIGAYEYITAPIPVVTQSAGDHAAQNVLAGGPEPRPALVAPITGDVLFVSAAPDTAKVTISCDGTTSTGPDRAAMAAEKADLCAVTVMLKDRTRMVTEVHGVEKGTYTCFTNGDKSCTKG